MSDKKISDLNPVLSTQINNNDSIPIVNGGETKKISINELSNIFSGLPINNDISVSGGTYDQINGVLTYFKTDGTTFMVSGITDNVLYTSLPNKSTTLSGNTGDSLKFSPGNHEHPIQEPSSDIDNMIVLGNDNLHRLESTDIISIDSDNMLIKGTDGKLTASLDAETIGVPLVGDFILGWTNGVLTIFPK